MTPYEILGVGVDAGPDEVRSAYRQLVRDLHPDTRSRELDPAVADEALRRVQWAYDAVADGPGADEGVPAADDDELHARVARFPWWTVAIAALLAIFVITAYAGSVPASSP